MKLYYDPLTVNCRKVVAGFHLIGMPYEAERLDYFAGDHKQPAYTKINPNQALPAATDGDFVLWESNAILIYAAEKTENTTAYPRDPKLRADILRWMFWESCLWFGACYVYLVENVIKPMLDDTPDQALLEAHAPVFHKAAAIVESRLDGRDWMCADHVTLADIVVASPMHFHGFQKLPLASYPHLRAWMARVEALPCWKASDPAPYIPAELLAKFAT